MGQCCGFYFGFFVVDFSLSHWGTNLNGRVSQSELGRTKSWVEVVVMSFVSHTHSAHSDLSLGGHSSQLKYILWPLLDKEFHNIPWTEEVFTHTLWRDFM